MEQLLLSTAADRAVADADLSSLKGTTAYVDTTHFEATDKGYVIVALRDSLGATGALLAPDQKAAEAVVEVGSGALALDRSDFLFGIPSIPIPIPGIGMFKTPEISLFKTISQKGVAKLRLFAREQKSGKQLLSTGPKAYSFVRTGRAPTTWPPTCEGPTTAARDREACGSARAPIRAVRRLEGDLNPHR